MLGHVKEGIEIIQLEVGFLELLIIPISRMDGIRDPNPSIAQGRPIQRTVHDRKTEINRARSAAASMISAKHKVPEVLPKCLHLLRMQRLVVVPENDERPISQRATSPGFRTALGSLGGVNQGPDGTPVRRAVRGRVEWAVDPELET